LSLWPMSNCMGRNREGVPRGGKQGAKSHPRSGKRRFGEGGKEFFSRVSSRKRAVSP